MFGHHAAQGISAIGADRTFIVSVVQQQAHPFKPKAFQAQFHSKAVKIVKRFSAGQLDGDFVKRLEVRLHLKFLLALFLQLCFSAFQIGDICECHHNGLRPGGVRIQKRLRIDQDPDQLAIRFVNAHHDIGAGFARPQRDHGRVRFSGEGRTIFMDGLPARVDRRAAHQLIGR